MSGGAGAIEQALGERVHWFRPRHGRVTVQLAHAAHEQGQRIALRLARAAGAFAAAGRYTDRMNDQSAGWSPDDDDERQRRAQSLQRAFMDRARRAVEHEHAPQPRPVWHRVVAVLAALVLTGTIVFVFDAFLSSMQKVMHMIDEQAEQEKQQEIERKKKEPMPAYVVPSE